MKIKSLGRTGLKVTEVCLGTMTFANQCDEATSFDIMDVADQAGVNFFDTADVYPLGGGADKVGMTEVYVGNWLKARHARERIVLATKCFGAMGKLPNDSGLSRKHIISACDASLRRLQTDYIDLYQTHQPDPNTPIDETLRALDDLVRAGKVRYIGCSNYAAHALSDALWTSRLNHVARYDSVQPRYNLLFRMIEDEILPVCRTHGVGVIVYNPLAGGMLTGRYNGQRQVQAGTRFGLGEGRGEMYQKRYWHDEIFDEVDRLSQFFASRGKNLTHAAIAWVLQQPDITSAIIGASTAAQLRDSLKGVGMTLDGDELAACNAAWFNLPRERDPQIARR